MTPAHSRSAPSLRSGERTDWRCCWRSPACWPSGRPTRNCASTFRHRRHPIPGGHRRFRRGRCPRSRPGRGDPRRPDPHGPVPPDQRRRRRPERRFGHLARRLALEGRRLLTYGSIVRGADGRYDVRYRGRHGQEGSAGRRGVLGHRTGTAPRRPPDRRPHLRKDHRRARRVLHPHRLRAQAGSDLRTAGRRRRRPESPGRAALARADHLALGRPMVRSWPM